ncbi:hypothetical protein [Kineobactrum salinum]|uniref:Uncharacterized protein n=1 Tax=Kineobactrum salinum TaxID=2708301 RepID=A0A6C0U5D2_9GAMM|nr:hypothetical protein [Kineobactrum salinum]QIB67138.1 hypothetical protein G3T16_18770 [Kineobactrum salinum]
MIDIQRLEDIKKLICTVDHYEEGVRHLNLFIQEAAQTQYLEKEGEHCPTCGSNDLQGGSVDVDSPHASQPMSCGDCRATWTDQYQLTGFADLKEGA